LGNPRVLFSNLPLERVPPPVRVRGRAEPPEVDAVETPDGIRVSVSVCDLVAVQEAVTTCLSLPIHLDEAEVLHVARRLLGFRLFETRNRSPADSNIQEAIGAYHRAADAADHLPCFQHLCIALEKAVNAGVRKRPEEPHRCAGMEASEIRKLRSLNDRLKHVSRNETEAGLLESLKSNLAQVSSDAKRAADLAILKRLVCSSRGLENSP
jgi:hypothetical protein